MRTPPRFDGFNSLGRESAVSDKEFLVLARENVVRDDGLPPSTRQHGNRHDRGHRDSLITKIVSIAQGATQCQREGRLA